MSNDFMTDNEDQGDSTDQPVPQPDSQSTENDKAVEQFTTGDVLVRTYFPRSEDHPLPEPPLPPDLDKGEASFSFSPEEDLISDETRPHERLSIPPLQEPVPLIREGEPPDSGEGKLTGCRLRIWVVFAVLAGLVCVLAAGGLSAWGYLNDMLPAQVAALFTPIPKTPPLPTPMGNVTPSLQTTATNLGPTVTGGVLIEPTGSPGTPGAGESPAPVTPTPDGTFLQEGVPMVYVIGGTFMMGSQAAERESPIHEVTLDPYYIDQYEVTNAQWAACVAAGVCSPPASTDAYDGTPYYGVEDFDNYPVVYVSWDDADAYCRWRGARLPTEAEWEMAARWNPDTGEVTVYPWGDEWDPARANYCDASCLLTDSSFLDPDFDDGWPQMAPVGSFPLGASPVGALDMAGNVAEWVADWFSRTYYAIAPAENPTGPATGTERVVRGGAWGVSSNGVRSAARSSFAPYSEGPGLGFRCAISAGDVP